MSSTYDFGFMPGSGANREDLRGGKKKMYQGSTDAGVSTPGPNQKQAAVIRVYKADDTAKDLRAANRARALVDLSSEQDHHNHNTVKGPLHTIVDALAGS